jgi:hypothetical protein
MRRSVTFSVAVSGSAGTRQERSIVFTSASGRTTPRSARRNMPAAATGFEMDAAWKRVNVSTGAPVAASRTP